MQNVKTDFIPSLHGFNFANTFSGYPIPPFIFTLPGISKVLSSSQINHGLCGGMCFATSDCFIAKRTIISAQTSPKPGTPLYRYLYRRQLDTYGAFGKFVVKFAQWTALPDSTVQRLTDDELQKVIAQLANGQIVILGLVYVSIVDTLAIWLNHQVLAYDYSENSRSINIKIYDPNLPCRDDVFIEVKTGSTGLQYIQKASRTNSEKRIRGFFVIPYTAVEPPI